MLSSDFLFAEVANRLCLSAFFETFNVWTNVRYTFEVGGKVYETALRHFSDLSVHDIEVQLDMKGNVRLSDKVTISVFVVNTSEFASKEDILKSTNKLRNEIDCIRPLQPKTNTSIKKKAAKFFEPTPSSSFWIQPFAEPKKPQYFTSMDSSLFIENTLLHKQVLSSPILIHDTYYLISSRSKLFTARSKTCELEIRLKRDLLECFVDQKMYISFICTNLVKETSDALKTVEKLSTTIKLDFGEQRFLAVAKDSTVFGPYTWRDVVFKENDNIVTIPTEFRMEIHYRLAQS